MNTTEAFKNKKTALVVAAVFVLVVVFALFYVLSAYNLFDRFLKPVSQDEFLLVVGSSLVDPDAEGNDTYPLMLFVNTRDWSTEELNLNNLPGLEGRYAQGAVEAEPFLLNGEQRWAVSTRSPGVFLILKKTGPSWDSFQVEFKEQVDNIVRAVFVGDITGDGKEEIVVGTRPKGILKYYAYENGQWSGTLIDTLDPGTIHDLLVADLDEDGLNEIVLSTHIPLHQITPEEKLPEYTPKLLVYNLDQKQNTWAKEVIAEYSQLFPLLDQNPRLQFGGLNFDEYYQHPRYLFFEDFTGDGSKEIAMNLRKGEEGLVAFRRKDATWQQLIIEDELKINRQVFAAGDITNNGRAEIIATPELNNELLLYAYDAGNWKRTVISERLEGVKLRPGEITQKETVQFAHVLEDSRGPYKDIVYMVSGRDAKAARFYVLSYNLKKDVWGGKLVADLPKGIQAWHVTSAFLKEAPKNLPLTENVFLPCDEKIPETSPRYGCYKDAALFAMQNGVSAQELFDNIEEAHKSWHFKEHAVGRAALIVADYNLAKALEHCASTTQGCTSGYGHGVSLAWGEYTVNAPLSDRENNTKLLLAFFETVCSNCFHYLGHYYGALPGAFYEKLGLCDSIADDADFTVCIMGALHQRFQDELPQVKNFFAECQDLEPERKQRACFGYGSYFFARWLSWDEGIQEALGICRKLNPLTPPQWNRCYEGVSEHLYRKGETPDISFLCEGLSRVFEELCEKDLSSPPQNVGLDEELGAGCSIEPDTGRFGCQPR